MCKPPYLHQLSVYFGATLHLTNWKQLRIRPGRKCLLVANFVSVLNSNSQQIVNWKSLHAGKAVLL